MVGIKFVSRIKTDLIEIIFSSGVWRSVTKPYCTQSTILLFSSSLLENGFIHPFISNYKFNVEE